MSTIKLQQISLFTKFTDIYNSSNSRYLTTYPRPAEVTSWNQRKNLPGRQYYEYPEAQPSVESISKTSRTAFQAEQLSLEILLTVLDNDTLIVLVDTLPGKVIPKAIVLGDGTHIDAVDAQRHGMNIVCPKV